MQSQETNNRTQGAVNHPSAAAWMAYLYNEIAPEQRYEMRTHLSQCPACGQQLDQWRAGMNALDEWRLPARRRPQPQWLLATGLKWAAAAVVVLAAGFAIGRQTSGAMREMTGLKASVALLTQRLESERGFAASNTVVAASAVANEETFRLLSEYARVDEQNRTEDRRTVALALREMESRLVKLRSELETVAVNTASGFQQTKDGLTTLASYTVTDRGDAADFSKPENKNQ